MPITFACVCGKQLKTKDESAGRVVLCPSCKAEIRVPDPQPCLDPWAIDTGEPSVESRLATLSDQLRSLRQSNGRLWVASVMGPLVALAASLVATTLASTRAIETVVSAPAPVVPPVAAAVSPLSSEALKDLKISRHQLPDLLTPEALRRGLAEMASIPDDPAEPDEEFWRAIGDLEGGR
jgi:hypothetical protein